MEQRFSERNGELTAESCVEGESKTELSSRELRSDPMAEISFDKCS